MLYADRPPEELGQFTGFLLNFLGTRAGMRFAAALEPHGIQPRDFGVLKIIEARPGMTQQELAELSRVDRSSMVALLDDLEERGLAERRAHPEDRRKRKVHLTRKGRGTLEKLAPVARQAGEDMFAPLTPDEYRTLHALLRKLAGLDG